MDTHTFSMHVTSTYLTSIYDLLDILILLRELYDWLCTVHLNWLQCYGALEIIATLLLLFFFFV